MRFWILTITLVVLFFLFPMWAGLEWPSSFEPTAIGEFIRGAWDYWVALANSIFRR